MEPWLADLSRLTLRFLAHVRRSTLQGVDAVTALLPSCNLTISKKTQLRRKGLWIIFQALILIQLPRRNNRANSAPAQHRPSSLHLRFPPEAGKQPIERRSSPRISTNKCPTSSRTIPKKENNAQPKLPQFAFESERFRNE
ncbi:hypothetical protein BKA80DRAFT_323437 [Phyllosticta citrichinensis]